MAKDKVFSSVREALASLMVKSGGRGTCARIPADLEVCLHEHEAHLRKIGGHPVSEAERPDDPYALTLRRRTEPRRERTIPLPRTDLFTKGRSMWVRDNTHRLKPEVVDKFTGQIEKVIADAPKSKG